MIVIMVPACYKPIHSASPRGSDMRETDKASSQAPSQSLAACLTKRATDLLPLELQ